MTTYDCSIKHSVPCSTRDSVPPCSFHAIWCTHHTVLLPSLFSQNHLHRCRGIISIMMVQFDSVVLVLYHSKGRHVSRFRHISWKSYLPPSFESGLTIYKYSSLLIIKNSLKWVKVIELHLTFFSNEKVFSEVRKKL